jgi:hypothetical protein
MPGIPTSFLLQYAQKTLPLVELLPASGRKRPEIECYSVAVKRPSNMLENLNFFKKRMKPKPPNLFYASERIMQAEKLTTGNLSVMAPIHG